MRRAAGSAGDGTGIMAGTLLSKMRASICSPKASRQVLAKAVLHRAAAREAAGLKTKTGPEAGTILAEDQAMIYKRGSIYWSKFQHSGRMIYKSTGQTSATKARQVEARLRSELAMGHYGILERKCIPTLAQFIRERIEPKVKEPKPKESSDLENVEQRRQKRFRWLRTALKPLSTHAIGRMPLDKITSEHVGNYGM